MGTDFDHISREINRGNYSLIGSGSGRLVYDLGNGYVVKKARNIRGIAQNRAEYHIATDSHSDLFARIIDISKNDIYLIMEKADRVRYMIEVWDYFKVKDGHEFFRTDQFRNIALKYKLLPNDLYRRSSWGIIDGRPVIVDYGFTRETRKYYTFFY